MKTRTILAGVLVLLTAGVAHAQNATNLITVQNFDFSLADAAPNDVAGWTEYDNGRTAIQPGGADGNGFCEMFGRFSGWDTRGFAQDIAGTNWVRGTYTFSFAYARTETAGRYIRTRLYFGAGAGNLPDSRVVFDQQVDVSSATIEQNTWFTNTVSFVVPDGHPAIGQPLGIRFSPDDAGAAAGTGKVGVDLVKLEEVRPLGDVDYPQENMVYFVGESVQNTPSAAGTPTSWSISPDIDGASGLYFNTADGSISGFTLAETVSSHVVTVRFAGGISTDVPLTLQIKNPGLGGYTPSNAIVTVNVPMTPMDPVLEGTGFAYPTGFTVSPPLPAGISLDPSFGSITGTPTATSSNVYTLTAHYTSYPDSSSEVAIVVVPPTLVRYADGEFLQTLGWPMRPVTPTLTGVDAPSGFTVSPPLPTGFSLDPLTGVLSGTNTVLMTPATHTITAKWAGYPDASVDISLEVIAGFADDFNGGIGTLADGIRWLDVPGLAGGFNFTQQSKVSAPGGNNGFAGPTTVYLGTNQPAGSDFEVSVEILTGGLGHGLVFGYQNETNFWMCRAANGAGAQGSGNDFILRCFNDGVQAVNLGLNVGPDIPDGANLTLTVRYDDDTQMLGFEILEGASKVYYSGTYAIQTTDLPIAEGSLFGIQSWTSAGTLFNNFSGNFEEQTIDTGSIEITDFKYDAATGEAILTWPGSSSKSYTLWGGIDVTNLSVIESGIPGLDGDTSVTNTQEVGTSSQFYQVEQN